VSTDSSVLLYTCKRQLPDWVF